MVVIIIIITATSDFVMGTRFLCHKSPFPIKVKVIILLSIFSIRFALVGKRPQKWEQTHGEEVSLTDSCILI